MLMLGMDVKIQMNIIGDYTRNRSKVITWLARKYKLSESTIRKEIKKYETRKVLMSQ